MVKFKSRYSNSKFIRRGIYIPIWLNSNAETTITAPVLIHLHYNMVKFKSKRFFSLISLLSYLHSNMVKFKSDGQNFYTAAGQNLHSNMVKFKCCRNYHLIFPFNIYIPIWLNSNEAVKKINKWRTSFTFQYG